jgi:hypothetical protein
MSDWTSTQAGNWSDNATWGGGGHPVSGDTATIGHAVAVDVTSAVGDPTMFPGNTCITVNVGGTLTINAGIILTVQNDIYLIGGALVMQAGSTMTYNSTALIGGGYRLRWQGTGNSITINGTSGSHCTITAEGIPGTNPGFYWQNDPNASYDVDVTINAYYCDFLLMGNAFGESIDLESNPPFAQYVYFNHCRWRKFGTFHLGTTYTSNAATVIKFENCDFRDCFDLLGNVAFRIGYGFGGDLANADTRWFKNCTFSSTHNNMLAQFDLEQVGISNPWLIQNCVFENIFLNATCYAILDHNIFRQITADMAVLLGLGSLDPITVENCILYRGTGSGSDLATVGLFGSADMTYQGNISFSDSANTCHFLMEKNSGANFNGNISRCICRGSNMFLANGASYHKTLTIERITHICTDVVGGAFKIIYEDLGADSTVNLRSLLVYSTQTNNLIADNSLDSTPDQLDYTDYNCVWNRNLTGRYGANIVITGKSVGDPGFGGSDIKADPMFRNANATLATWDLSLGGAGTITNAFGELLKLNGYDRDGTVASYNSNYSVTNSLAYFRNAYTPTNLSLKGKGYGGKDIGAIDASSNNSWLQFFY